MLEGEMGRNSTRIQRFCEVRYRFVSSEFIISGKKTYLEANHRRSSLLLLRKKSGEKTGEPQRDAHEPMWR